MCVTFSESVPNKCIFVNLWNASSFRYSLWLWLFEATRHRSNFLDVRERLSIRYHFPDRAKVSTHLLQWRCERYTCVKRYLSCVVPCAITKTELSFLWNCHYWLHRNVWCRHLPEQPVKCENVDIIIQRCCHGSWNYDNFFFSQWQKFRQNFHFSQATG